MPSDPVRLGLFVHTLHVGGAEGQLLELVRAIDRRRVEPRLITFHLEGPHVAALAELGVAPEAIPLPSSLARPGTAATIARVAAWCRSRRIDVLHPQDLYTNLVALPAARLAGARCLVSRLDLSHWYGGLRRAAVAWTSRHADRVWVNADAVRQIVAREDGVAGERIELIRNGIDLPRFDGLAAEASAEAIELAGAGIFPSVIQVANMNHPVKGQEDLLAAMVLVLARVPRARLLLVGDGPLRPTYERRARELGLGAAVRFAGRRADVPALLRRSAVAVSASSAEGLSNAVIESMAAGLPVVATAVGGNVELVRNARDGWLVPPRAPWALADRIVWLLEHPGRAREMGASGRRRVEGELPLHRMVRAFEDLYERLARRRDRASASSPKKAAATPDVPGAVPQPAD